MALLSPAATNLDSMIVEMAIIVQSEIAASSKTPLQSVGLAQYSSHEHKHFKIAGSRLFALNSSDSLSPAAMNLETKIMVPAQWRNIFDARANMFVRRHKVSLCPCA